MTEKNYRTIDLGRAAGLSVQQVRNYEELGLLPTATRSANGYRRYQQRHLDALLTARIMIAGYGWQAAQQIMEHAHAGDLGGALALIDARHATIDHQRHEVEALLKALRTLAVTVSPARRGIHPRAPLTIGEAAREVGVRPSALRFWEAQQLLHPQREHTNSYRRYDEAELRRLQVVALLRSANYGFDAIRTVLDELGARRADRALQAVRERLLHLTEQSRRGVEATVAFWGYWQRYEQTFR